MCPPRFADIRAAEAGLARDCTLRREALRRPDLHPFGEAGGPAPEFREIAF
jgi:hypothetical protein